jgi:phage tail sheath gpL-like
MSGVPSNIMIPFMGLDFDGSQANAGPEDMPIQMLIIGQRLSAGTVPAETLDFCTSESEAALKHGFGSGAHRMFKKAVRNGNTFPIGIISLADTSGATKATRVVTITGTATERGELPLYIAGQRYAVTVEVGDGGADVVTGLAAAATADVNNLPCTVGGLSTALTATAKQGGVAFGDLDVRVCYNRGEKVPAGITVSIAATTPGTVDPDITDALAAVGSQWFNVIANPYTDNTSMNILESWLAEQNGVMVQKTSVAIGTVRDTRANLVTYGTDVANRNSAFVGTFPGYGMMASTYELSAGVAAAIAASIQEDPAIPLHRMNLVGFDVVASADSWTDTERNNLAVSSICTLTHARGVQTESVVTMYRQNSAGGADTAYQQMNTVFQLSASRYYFVNQILNKYPRAKLSTSGGDVKAGQSIMTLDIAEAEAIAWFKDMQFEGIFELGEAVLAQFKKELRVHRNGSERVEWLLPPDLMNQFIVGSGTIQFRK